MMSVPRARTASNADAPEALAALPDRDGLAGAPAQPPTTRAKTTAAAHPFIRGKANTRSYAGARRRRVASRSLALLNTGYTANPVAFEIASIAAAFGAGIATVRT